MRVTKPRVGYACAGDFAAIDFMQSLMNFWYRSGCGSDAFFVFHCSAHVFMWSARDMGWAARALPLRAMSSAIMQVSFIKSSSVKC